MAGPLADARPRIARPVALGIVAVILLATAAAFAWPSLPFNRTAAAVVGPTKVDVITQQIGGAGAKVGEDAPDFAWVAPDGRTVRLSSLRGHPVVLDFWATWCVPCKTEMPLLDKAAAAHRGVRFLAVDLDEDGTTIRAYFDQMRITALEPVLDVGLQTSYRYGVVSVPSAFFIDAHGIIRRVQTGEMDASMLQAGLAAIR
ncbi:MAG: TlpA family protein disulfide reductase [Chloroflexota bacterium]|nr:TlpA family protein disulfide reductase [Chloroflexota bacterium]MDE3102167.1 TlpA family protein disulfide reductase [Chloroflexota bacterium]